MNYWKLKCYYVLLLLAALGTGLPARADQRDFVLGGVSFTLEEVTADTAVYFTSMRLNRAVNAWNVEATVSNRSARVLSGPLVLLVESATGTSGLLQPDGVSSNRAFVDLSGQLDEGVLSPANATTKRTLALGFTAGTPAITTRVYALASPAGVAVAAFLRSLNEVGQPLGSVRVDESSPAGARTDQTDPVFGVATVGQTPGENLWKFSLPDHLPVWRRQVLGTNGVELVIHPRLTRRNTNSAMITPLSGGVVSNETITVTFGAGAVNSNQLATLTPLTAQTLPALLPLGWSPLQAFWLEFPGNATIPPNAALIPWGPFGQNEAGALVQWNEQTLRWEVRQLFASSGTNPIPASLPGAGAFALVVADAAPNAPPVPQAGQPLPGATTALPAAGTLSAGGVVMPSASPASLVPELVTGMATVAITNSAGVLPSGLVLRCDVREEYLMADGTRRVTPRYEHFIVGYQRPGDSASNTLHAGFPIRPLVLFEANELDEAVVRVEVLPPSPFGGTLLTTSGGLVAGGNLRVLAGAGDLAGSQAALLRQLDPADFTFLTAGLNVPAAFDLSVSGVTPGQQLTLQMSGAPSNAVFVVARVLHERRAYGMEPVERLASDAQGRLFSLETNTTDRLPGITGAGQFLLVQVGQPQALVRGVARNAQGQPAAGMLVRLGPWTTLSRAPDGSFLLLAPAGDNQLVITDLATGDIGQSNVPITPGQTVANPSLGTALTGPRVVTISPTNNATGVQRVTSVVINFSRPLNPATLLNDSVRLLGASNQPVAASFSLNLANTRATLLPGANLEPVTLHRVVLSTNIADTTGRQIEGPTEFTFTTVALPVRDPAAQLIIYEPGATNVPTNIVAQIPAYVAGSNRSDIVVRGTPGVADPGVAVILVNESSGQTSTVLSKPDGSFVSVIEGVEDDFVSATFINLNNTRVYVPVSRQEFDNGFVGLYRQGGILEAQSDGGPVRVYIQPEAIKSKAKLRLSPLSPSQVAALLGGVQPETARGLATPVSLDLESQPLQGPISMSFTVDLLAAGYPTNADPAKAAIALVRVTDTDGIKAFEVLDQMKFTPRAAPRPGTVQVQDGEQLFYGTVNSVIGLIPGAGIANNIFRYVLMPLLIGGEPIVVKGRVLQSVDIPQLDNPFAINDPLLQGFNYSQLGKGLSVLDTAGQGIELVNNLTTTLTDTLKGRPLGGAFVSLQNHQTPNIPGRVRPGMVYATSDRTGYYLMVAPTTPLLQLKPEDFYLVMATHPKFTEKLRAPMHALQDLDISGVVFKDFVFREPVPLQVPPEINIAHSPPFPAAGEQVTVQVNASQGFQGNPTINVFVTQVVPTNLPLTSVQISNEVRSKDGNRSRWSATVQGTNTVFGVVLKVSATPSAGPPVVTFHRIGFTGEPRLAGGPITVSDPGETNGPVVTLSLPVEGGLVNSAGEVTLYFNEPIDRMVETNTAGLILTPATPGATPAVRLNADQTVLTLHYAGLLPDTDYSLTLSGASAVDLSGNSLDQRPSSAAADAFSLSFRTPPVARFNLPGMVNGVGSVIHGALVFALDNTTPPVLRTYSITNLENPRLLSSVRVVGIPRDLVVIPNYSYRLNVHEPTRTNDLVAVVGGDLDAILESLDNDTNADNVIVKGQYLRVFEMGDPANPVEIASPILSYRVGAAVTKVRWHAPFLVYQEFAADLHQLVFVDLQEHLIGRHATRLQRSAFREVSTPGVDDNQDGDYADPGDLFPVPALLPAEFDGKKQSHVISGSTQRMLDFSVDGGTIGVTLTAGYALKPNGEVDRERFILPQYRTIVFDGQEIPFGSISFAQGDVPGRVTVISGLPIEDKGRLFTPIVALVSLSPDSLGGHHLVALDISLPETPKIIGDLAFPAELVGGNLRSILRIEEDLIELTTVSHTFRINSRLLSQPNPPAGQMHPAVVGFFPNSGGRMRSSGTSPYGVRSVAEGGRNEIIQSAPVLSFVSFPFTNQVVDPRHIARTEEALQELMGGAQPAEYIVPARVRPDHLGHISDLFPANPRVHYYVVVEAPGGAGETIELGMESCSPAAWPLPNKGAGFPPVRAVAARTLEALDITLRPECDASVRSLKAYRLSNIPSSPFYNRYLSRPFVVVYEAMSIDDLNFQRLEADREILWSGALMRAFIEPSEQLNTPIARFAARVDVPRSVIFPVASALAQTLDVSYIMGPNPPPPGGSEPLDGTYGSISAHNGEFRTSANDLSLPSPRMPIGIERVIGGQDNYDGPFGLGWDFNYNQRITELQPQLFPQGFKMPLIPRGTIEDSVVGSSKDMLFHTGAGRIALFQWKSDKLPPEYAADPLVQAFNYNNTVAGYFLPEPGVFDLFVKFKDGKYERLTPDGMRYRYAANGRLETIIDRFPANRHELEYDRRGWLRRIDDRSVTADRFVEFGYYRRDNDVDFVTGLDERSDNSFLIGKVCRLRDYAGRDVLYFYNDEGLLIRREGIQVDGENGGYAGRNQTHYLYEKCRIVGVAIGKDKTPLIASATKAGTQGVSVANSSTGTGLKTQIEVPADNAAHKLDNQKTTTQQEDGRVTEVTVDKYGNPKVTSITGPGVDPAQLEQEYDKDGLETFTKYPEGRIHRSTYDTNNPVFRSRGNLLRMVVEPGPRGGAGYTETYSYDPRYNLASGAHTVANGFTVAYQLSPDGRFVRSIQHGTAGIETFDYDARGQLLGHTDYDGLVSSCTYDSATGFVRTTVKGTHTTTQNYGGDTASLLGEPASVQPPRGAAIEFKYDRSLQAVEVKRAASLQQMAYDEQGRMAYHREVVGDGKQRESRMDFDVKGFVTKRRISGVEVNGTEAAIEYVYEPDEHSRVKSVLHPGGTKQVFTYNTLGHLTKMSLETYEEEYKPDRHGNVLEVRKGGEVVATMEYDGLDRAKSVNTLTGTRTYLTQLTYFPGGELKTQMTTDPAFGIVEDKVINELDALGRVLSSTVNGDSITRTDTTVPGALKRTTTGPRQAVTEEWNTAGYPTRFANAIQDSVMTPDGNGNVERVVRSEEGTSYADIFTYNELDQQLTAADNFGPVAEYTPRADGNDTQVKNARNNVSTIEHSSLGEVLRNRRADGMEFRFRHDEQRQTTYSGDPGAGFAQDYDNLFRPTRHTQRNGAEITNDAFDARNQPTSVTIPGGKMTTTYDRLARTKTSKVSFGSTTYEISTDHDALNRARVVNYEQSGGSPNRASYTYDKAGPLLNARFEEAEAEFSVGYSYRNDFSRTRITYPSGYVVNEERDNSGRLIRISGTIGDIVAVTAWQGNSLPKSVDYGGVLRMDSTYDSRGRLTASRYVRTPGGALQAELRYQRDGADNLEMRQFLHRAGKADNFTYDNGERMVRAQVGGIPLEGIADLGRLTFGRTYGYDATGLDYLLAAPTTGPAGSSPPPFSESWTAHDSFLLPATVGGVSRGNPDVMGRVAQAQLWTRPVVGSQPVPLMASFQHNGLGELVRVERSDGVVIENFFQPGGLRYARKVTQGGSVLDYRHFVYDDVGRMIEEFDRTGAQPNLIGRYFYMASFAPCAADLPDANGTLRRHYFIADDQASIVAVADRFGVAEERVWYDPFGQPVIEPRDSAAPVIKRVIGGAGGTLLIEMSEPVTDIVFDLGLQPGIRRLNPSYTDLISQPAGKTDLPEAVPGFAPYTVIVFTPDAPLIGSTNLTLRPGKLTDDWDNHVLEQTVAVTVTGNPGDSYFVSGANPVTDSGTVARSTVGSPFLFHGQYFDYDSGLIFLGARVYDPFSAMFLEPDPAGYEDSVNLYAAFGNNPASRVDPSGLEWIQIGDKQMGIVAQEIIDAETAAGRNGEVLQSALAVRQNPMAIAEGSHAVNIQKGSMDHNSRVYQALLASGASANMQSAQAFHDISDSAQESAGSLRSHIEGSGFKQFETAKLAGRQEFMSHLSHQRVYDKKKGTFYKANRPYKRMPARYAQDAFNRMKKNSNSGGSEIWYRFHLHESGSLRAEAIRIDEFGHLSRFRDGDATPDLISHGLKKNGFGEPPHFHMELVTPELLSKHRKDFVPTTQFGADRQMSVPSRPGDPVHLKKTHNLFKTSASGITPRTTYPSVRRRR